MTSRRGFLKGIAALAAAGAAPALIREGFAMPVKPELGRVKCIDSNAWAFCIDNGGHGPFVGDLVVASNTPWSDELTFRAGWLEAFYTRSDIRDLVSKSSLEPLKECGQTIHWHKDKLPLKINHEVGRYGEKGDSGDWTVQLEAWRDAINTQRAEAGLLGVAHVPTRSMLDFPSHPSYPAGHGVLDARSLKEFRKRYPMHANGDTIDTSQQDFLQALKDQYLPRIKS